jgi:hypothetical protein
MGVSILFGLGFSQKDTADSRTVDVMKKSAVLLKGKTIGNSKKG